MKYRAISHGGVTSPRGYKATGVAAGIKSKKTLDFALVASDVSAVIGAVFTTNQVHAAPVKISKAYSKRIFSRGVVINSGNANACTGQQGLKDAKKMADGMAGVLGLKSGDILVCSTGRIGTPLPMEAISKGILLAAGELHSEGGSKAAKAIMTTDTYQKSCAIEFKLGKQKIIIGGMAKGAGMIHPQMATMLGIITTDAAIDKKVLQECTRNAVNQTFNCISVDGDTSTNDTVLVFANGLAKNLVLKKSSKNLSVFQNALTHVMHQLAQMIIEDGEGISRIVELQIKGAKSSKDAKMAANAIARSPLVKASWAGGDPNWGRLLSTIGHTEVKIDESKTDIFYNELFVVKKGIYSGLAIKKLEQAVAKRRFKITIDLHLGKYQHTLFVNDLTEAYVTFNKGEPSTPQPPPK